MMLVMLQEMHGAEGGTQGLLSWGPERMMPVMLQEVHGGVPRGCRTGGRGRMMLVMEGDDAQQ